MTSVGIPIQKKIFKKDYIGLNDGVVNITLL